MILKGRILLLLLVGIAASASAQTITTISPDTAPQGTTGLAVTFTLGGIMLPPTFAIPDSVTIGTLSGTSVAHPSSSTVTTVFDIGFSELIGTKDARVSFSDPMGNADVYVMSGGFTVTAGADTAPTITKQPTSKTVYEGYSTSFSVTASGSDPLEYHWKIGSFEMIEETNSTYVIPAASLADEADYTCIVSNAFGAVTSSVATLTINTNAYPGASGFVMVDTMQEECYDASGVLSAPAPGEAVAGQEAQYAGAEADYTQSSDDLTVCDNNTGLTRTRSSDTDRDDDIDAADQLTYDELFTYAASLNEESFG